MAGNGNAQPPFVIVLHWPTFPHCFPFPSPCSSCSSSSSSGLVAVCRRPLASRDQSLRASSRQSKANINRPRRCVGRHAGRLAAKHTSTRAHARANMVALRSHGTCWPPQLRRCKRLFRFQLVGRLRCPHHALFFRPSHPSNHATNHRPRTDGAAHRKTIIGKRRGISSPVSSDRTAVAFCMCQMPTAFPHMAPVNRAVDGTRYLSLCLSSQ